ncbi:MAG: 2-hydroxyacid dehydrogenase [Bryobacteraceae bacterium]
MRVAIFSAKNYERRYFEAENLEFDHDLAYLEARLNGESAVLAGGYPCVCAFVNDDLNSSVLQALAEQGTKLIALRSAGFNHVDVPAAYSLGMAVVRVPAYSPYAVAEHTIALILSLNRKIHRAYNRVREGNFALDGLLGFDLFGRTAGVIGTGKIGLATARILVGFGCRVLAYDPFPSQEAIDLGVEYVSLEHLYASSDIVTLHCPLTAETHHMINAAALERMRDGVMLINTSRGALVDTRAVIRSLKTGKIGYLGLDVYEEEANLFFEDQSNRVLQDDVFARLLTFPNVIITGHQGFFTHEALVNIVRTTLANIHEFETKGKCANEVRPERVSK